MPSSSHKTLLLGLGSEVLRDAGIGPLLAREVQKRYHPENTDLATSIVGGLDLLHMISPYSKVIIFDSTLSKNTVIGEIKEYHYPDCPDSLHLSNGHDADFSMLNDIAVISGMAFPGEITIFTVTVSDPFSVSDQLSDELTMKFDDIVDKVFALLKNKLEISQIL